MAVSLDLIKFERNTKHTNVKDPLTGQPAVYVIEHIETDKVYIGSTKNLLRRCKENINCLENNKHKNKPLQQAYNKNNNINIYYNTCDSKEEADFLEQKVVTILNKHDKVFNLAVIDTKITGRGRKLSEEHKNILKNSNINRVVTNETKLKMRQSQLQYCQSEKGIERINKLIEDRSKPIELSGVKYKSMSEASRQLNVSWSTINRRIKK